MLLCEYVTISYGVTLAFRLTKCDPLNFYNSLGYTFFVPTDDAFEAQGLKNAPDNFLSTGDGLQVLLSHFVKARLYDKDLTDNSTFPSLGEKPLHLRRLEGNNFL